MRRAQEGMLLLVDGSCHDWLEGRGPVLTPLRLIDDATGKVPAAHFQLEHKNSAGYLHLLRTLVEGPGIPVALYLFGSLDESSSPSLPSVVPEFIVL
jgi:hypothetical protein